MDISLTDTATKDITLTETAADKLGGILDQKGLRASHALRVFVKGGGCGGMQYGMTFDDDIQEADQVFEQFGLRVVVDPTSFFYVGGASIDYIDNLMGGGFHIENPKRHQFLRLRKQLSHQRRSRRRGRRRRLRQWLRPLVVGRRICAGRGKVQFNSSQVVRLRKGRATCLPSPCPDRVGVLCRPAITH